MHVPNVFNILSTFKYCILTLGLSSISLFNVVSGCRAAAPCCFEYKDFVLVDVLYDI